jgi:hypothetical protein
VKAAPKKRLGLALDSPRFHQTPFVIASDPQAAYARDDDGADLACNNGLKRKLLLSGGFLLSPALSSSDKSAVRAFHKCGAQGWGYMASLNVFQWLRYGPWLAQVVVTRRCNLKCGYCTETSSTPSIGRFELAKSAMRLRAGP